jgi:putative transposase
MRYLALFVIDLKIRRVHVAGVTSQTDGTWMARIARKLTDTAVGPLRGYSHLIVDREIRFTPRMQSLLSLAGVSLLRLPPSSPNLNACANRFVRSIEQECLRHCVALGEHHCARSSGSSSSIATPSATTRDWAT